LTHTPLEHWRSVLRAWTKMLRPGGIAAFTFLSQSYLESWQAGKMQNYGTYSREQQAAIIRSIDQEGFGFAALTATYGDAPFYGIAMAKRDIVSREVTAAGLELLAIPDDAPATFGQDLALVRKPGVQRSRPVQVSHSSAEVSVVAFYDPRCYAPREDSEGDHTASLWARLLGKKPAGPLPSELGFADPRIPEVREAQASLAKEHGIDAFCYLYYWNGRPRWDSAWRDLVTTDRPDFPFCFLVTIQGDELLTPSSAMRLIQDILPALRDHRYLRLEGRPLVIVSDVTRMTEPRTIARSWRAAAQRDGIGELHLSAAEPVAADCPEDLGFDSFLQGPASGDDQFGLVAEALVRPWPHHRFFRTIRHKWDPSDPQSCHLYEHWLRSAFEAARRPGENLVFIDSWNDWLGGCYLEPDDRNGRAALLATRRATLGPASGPVLLRQLRESLRGVNAHLEPVLEELAHVLSLRDDASVRLIATVEAALCRNQEATTEPLREITVASRQLPSSPGRFSLDRVDNIIGADLYDREDPVFVSNVEVCLAGWCHAGDEAPDNVDLFLALESTIRTGSGEDLIFRVTDRIPRPDVASAIPGYPPNCGFESTVNLTCMKPGLYRVALVQRTPRAAYRDATPTIIRIEPKSCSSD
ncbi:MAG TPA: glycoside hydrolase family 99-like domain-containing protein, partial [Blastocatellia bacterium]|nr:glycoside hydrolase family 99-like domain-containing protein [Blastocatellia bacterium]